MLPTDGRSNQFEFEKRTLRFTRFRLAAAKSGMSPFWSYCSVFLYKKNAQSLRRRFRGAVSPVLYFRAANGTPPLARKRQPSIYRMRPQPDPSFSSFPSGGFPYHNLGFSLGGFTAFHPSVAGRLRLCGTFRLLGTPGVPFTAVGESIPRPALRRARTLRASQPGRAGTFLYPAQRAEQRLPAPRKETQRPCAFLLPSTFGRRDLSPRQTRARKGVRRACTQAGASLSRTRFADASPHVGMFLAEEGGFEPPWVTRTLTAFKAAPL